MDTLKGPVLTMLCGIPTSGKSTYLANKPQWTSSNYVVLSTDSYIECVAKANNSTYNEMFDQLISKAQEQLNSDLREALKANKNIIWDQTNLTPKARRKKLTLIPAHYEKHAVWFDISTEEALKRNKCRLGKVIPARVIIQMAYSFTPPTLTESFTHVIKAN